MKKFRSEFLRIKDKFLELDFPGMAAEMAYNFILALFPFFIFLISVFGLLGSRDLVNRIINAISFITPADISDILENILNKIVDSSNFGLLTFGFVIALWSASNAINVMLKTINKTYETTEPRPYIKNRLISMLVIILITIMLFISLNLIIFGRVILEFISNFINIPWDIQYSILLVRWPISFLTLFVIAIIIYYITPNIRGNVKEKIISVMPGALFFCIFWLLGSWLFSLYVENFGRYNETFGILGGFVVLLLWLYFSSIIILTGGAINSEYYNKLNKNHNF